MKRLILIIVLSLVSFALGWMSVCFRVQKSADNRIARAEAGHAIEIARIRQRIYGANNFHLKGISSEDDARLEQFDPSDSKGVIAMSYVGGLGGADIQLRVQADGTVSVTDHGVSRKVSILDQDRCADFFRRVLTSGILNFSPDVVEIKAELTELHSIGGVMDAPMTSFQISVPELGIDKKFSVCAPRSDLKQFPDIIEFQLVVMLEDEIQGFVPKDDPFWK